ncbi:hypothetical protein [Streptomyces sp. NBC_01185]|nr:hypothetical protein OG770_36555 [Streptomyces sp. NBC_01185]
MITTRSTTEKSTGTSTQSAHVGEAGAGAGDGRTGPGALGLTQRAGES